MVAAAFARGMQASAPVKKLAEANNFFAPDLLSSLQINAGVRFGSAEPAGEPRSESCCFTFGSCRFCEGGAAFGASGKLSHKALSFGSATADSKLPDDLWQSFLNHISLCTDHLIFSE